MNSARNRCFHSPRWLAKIPSSELASPALAAEPVVHRERPCLARRLLGLAELAGVELHQPPGEERLGALGRGGQARAGTPHRYRLLVQGDRLPVWAGAEIGPQVLAQPLELPHGGAPVPGLDRAPHECPVRLLIGGVHVEHPLPQPRGLQQPQVQHAQPLSRLLRPRRVTILREQLSPVGVQRPGLTSASSGLEGQRIHDHGLAGAQFQHRAVAADGARRAQGSAREVDCLAQVGRGRAGGQIGPQQVHDVFAVQAMRLGQGEDLHQFGCPLVPPRVVWHRLAVNPNGKPA